MNVLLLYLRASVNGSGQATVGNHSTRMHHWNPTLQVTGKSPCSIKVKQQCGTFIFYMLVASIYIYTL